MRPAVWAGMLQQNMAQNINDSFPPHLENKMWPSSRYISANSPNKSLIRSFWLIVCERSRYGKSSHSLVLIKAVWIVLCLIFFKAISLMATAYNRPWHQTFCSDWERSTGWFSSWHVNKRHVVNFCVKFLWHRLDSVFLWCRYPLTLASFAFGAVMLSVIIPCLCSVVAAGLNEIDISLCSI